MRHLIWTLILLATPVMAQSERALSELFTVTGVASNDTLNVRTTPSASAAILGALQPSETVEILRLSDDGNWGRVSIEEASGWVGLGADARWVPIGPAAGWVSMRFLRQTPEAIGRNPDLPFGMPAEMACSGTEPFWGLHLRTGQFVQSSDFNEASAPETYAMTGAANVANRSTDHFAFTAPPLTGFLTREMCDDGVSEAEFGWSLYLLRQREDGVVFMQGCCRALQP
jgi:uncharacterized membrane protein